MPIVHIIGAITLFAFGNAYLWMQVVISFHMRRAGQISLCACVIRLILAILTSICFIISTVAVSYASTRWEGDHLHWKAKNPGYTAHVVGDISEWFVVFSLLMFTVSVTKELGKGRLQISYVVNEANYEPVPVQSKIIEDSY